MNKKTQSAGTGDNATKTAQNKGKGKGNNTATAGNTTTTDTNVAASGSAEGEGDSKPAAAGNTDATAAATAAPKKLTIKVVPKKVRQGGGGGRTAATTYNVGTCPYNMLVTKTDKETKEKDTKFLRHILNGAWVPTFNGMEGVEVNPDLPVFKTIAEAFAAGAGNIGFGIATQEDGTDYPTIFSFKSNINNIDIKGEKPAAGQPDTRVATIVGTLTQHAPANALELALIDGKNDGVSWKWFGHIQATAENASKVAANLKAYMESPYADKGIVSSLTLLSAPWALSSGAAATVGTSTEVEVVA